jgi:hypothetical protein
LGVAWIAWIPFFDGVSLPTHHVKVNPLATKQSFCFFASSFDAGFTSRSHQSFQDVWFMSYALVGDSSCKQRNQGQEDEDDSPRILSS